MLKYNQGGKKMKKLGIISLFIFSLMSNTGDIKVTNAMTNNSEVGKVKTSGSNLNVRENASTSSKIITKLKNDTLITIVSTHSNFYKIEYKDDKYGYVHKNYISKVNSNIKKVNASTLNVRSGSSTSYKVIDKLNRNELVATLSLTNNFYKILYDGSSIGYVHKNYLNDVTTYSSINLNVVSYKQTDSRWGSKKIGKSTYTISKAGCLITSMSMSESYRRGITVTPTYIVNNFSFTSSGNMYWPSNYSTSTSSSYLQTIYTNLKNNKPTIIGAKKNDGSMHFVIVKGFKGSNTLSKANFIINDPGSNTRTTLSEFMSAYPNFYKIAYYK